MTEIPPNFTSFHSAVNRIPVLRNSARRLAGSGRLSQDLFLDGHAPGHDHLAPDRWSGSIALDMLVRTPLVFGEQEDGRVTLPTDGDGHPIVPPTMVKGMISRAYETLTCSRFRVFGSLTDSTGGRHGADDQTRPLTYRAGPAAATGLIPGRICSDDDGLAVEILDGFGKGFAVALMRDDLERGHGTLVTKNHPALRAGPGGRVTPIQVMTRFRNLTRHGQETEVRITQWKDKNGQRHLMVTGVWMDDEFEEFFDVGRGQHVNVWGYPCRTSPDHLMSRELYGDKTYERFFFKATRDGTSLDGTVLPLSPDQVERYATVLTSYRDQRETPNGAGHQLNRAAATRHDPHRAPLADGDLVFVKLSCAPADLDETRDARVIDVFPTMVGRRAYAQSPVQLGAAQNVLPLTGAHEASSADRLFGYVIQNPRDDAAGGDVSSRGRISFDAIDTAGAEVSTHPKVLSPLLEPKTSSARRFLTDASGGTPGRSDSRSSRRRALSRSEHFASDQLLGAAAYPIHRSIIEGDDLDTSGFPKRATLAPQFRGEAYNNDSVRLTAITWMRAGSRLRGVLRFNNLSAAELGALLWILTPENLVPPDEKTKNESAVGYLRMGLGKPLGLGAIEVRIAKGGLRARRGSDLADHYAAMSGCLGMDDPETDPAVFPLPNEDALRRTPWIQAMQRAAFGYSDGIPVRYMTLEENKANNVEDPKTGLPRSGRGQSPASLSARSPRPMKIEPS